MDQEKMDSIMRKIATRHKITRRQFLKTAAGTAAGAALLSVPWKGTELFAARSKKKGAKGENPVRIAFLGAMNFPLSVGGWRSIQIGVDEINEAGGILGRPVELVGPYDDQGRPEDAIKMYEKAVWTDKVDFVLDGMLDDSSAAVMKRVAETDVITLGSWVSTVACSDKVWQDYDKYKNWFMGVANDWGLVIGIRDYVENFLGKKLGWKSVVIFREDLIWTQGCAEYAYEEFPKIGMQVKGDVVFPIDTVDYAPLFDQCVKSKADGIICFLAAVATVPLAQYMKLEVPMVIAGVNTDAAMYEFYEDSGGSLGACAQWGCFAGQQSPKTRAFMEKYWNKFKDRPRLPEHCGFDGYTNLFALKDAIERAKSFESKAVVKELERTYAEFYYDWPWFPGGWFGMERPASPKAVPERYRRPAFKGSWEGLNAPVAPHVWGVPEMVRWGQWQAPSQVKPVGDTWNLDWQAKNFPKNYGRFVCIWPPEFVDGEFQLPPWM